MVTMVMMITDNNHNTAIVVHTVQTDRHCSWSKVGVEVKHTRTGEQGALTAHGESLWEHSNKGGGGKRYS